MNSNQNIPLVLAYSGGLDTSYCIKKMSQEGYDVHAVAVNTGGFDTQTLQTIQQKAMDLGAKEAVVIDALERYYETVIQYLIYGNVLKNNTYPLSVSAERIVQALELITYAKAKGAQAIAHGSTGAGNDQVRFDLIFQVLAPEIKIITPIRDQQLTRQQEVDYLKSQGIDWAWEKAQYSINAGLWGTSVGGAETLTSHKSLPDAAYPSPLEKETPEALELEFLQGELKGVNGKPLSPVVAMQEVQDLARTFAIGRDIHVGDTIVGIKGRVGFEAAAALVIIKAHHLLEKHTLSKWQQFQKEQVGQLYGMLLHEGQYLDPVMRDMEAYLKQSQAQVSGKVFLKLHPYRFELEGITSENDLMNPEFGAYGEENAAWTAEEAKGFIKLLSVPNRIYQQVHKSKSKT
ncbi:MAG: argininosuccinate synthase [Flavobacteriaceae bacterium]